VDPPNDVHEKSEKTVDKLYITLGDMHAKWRQAKQIQAADLRYYLTSNGRSCRSLKQAFPHRARSGGLILNSWFADADAAG